MLWSMLGTMPVGIPLVARSFGQRRVNSWLGDQVENQPRGYPMRCSEIRARPAPPNTHPFTADITIHPTVYDEFERVMEQHDARLLARIDLTDRCLVHLGCS